MAQAYRVQSRISPDGTLKLENVPFQPGETVEVIVLAEERLVREQRRYPLRGKPLSYQDPMEGIGTSEWDALR
jgi:hypothetical protein